MQNIRGLMMGVILAGVLLLAVAGRSQAGSVDEPGTFTATGSMKNQRYHHTATLLPNGKVLVAGGVAGGSAPVSQAELYDPQAGLFSATGNLNDGRFFHAATLLLSNKVLITGGYTTSSFIKSAEIYDLTTGTFQRTSNMNFARRFHTSTRLVNGKVLITGGTGVNGAYLDTAELYDPTTGLFTLTGKMNSPKDGHTATLLDSGKVLIVGGNANGVLSPFGEIYDPATGLFTKTGDMLLGRAFHASVKLADGKVLVAGGNFNNMNWVSPTISELYDPISNSFSLSGAISQPRGCSGVLLSNGKVLIVGGGYYDSGSNTWQYRKSAEIYDPMTKTFNNGGIMSIARGGHTVTVLSSGMVLVAGGTDRALNCVGLPSAELYTPSVAPAILSTGVDIGGSVATNINKGQPSTITWTITNISGTLQIDLYKGETMVQQLAASAANTGRYPFTPSMNLADGSDYRIGISAENGKVSAFSGNFTIQNRAAAIPDHFHFSTIASPQLPKSDIPIRIEAHDAGHTLVRYNGEVDLASSSGAWGALSPTYTTMQDGMKDLLIQINRLGLLRLKASSREASGESNEFRVVGAGPCENKIVIGTSETGKNGGLMDVHVTMNDSSGNEVLNVFTDPLGNAFSNGPLPCDRYTIKASKDGFLDAQQTIDTVGGSAQWPDVEMSRVACLDAWCTPVIVIPGMMGSSSGLSIYPKLPEQKPAPVSKLRIHDPRHPVTLGRVTGFTALREYLSGTFDVIECPWDWRLPIDEVAKEYLIPAIDQALKASKTGKVHIVAHSMGGLVARAYLQGAEYAGRNDVDKMLFVGTPHLGSVNPYYIWEGGDPKLIDDITDGSLNSLGLDSLANIYSNTIQNLWQETYHKWFWLNTRHQAIKAFVQDKAPSLLQLMSTGDFLHSVRYGAKWGTFYPANVNTRLNDLNKDAHIGDIISADGSGGSKVHAGVLVGNKEKSTLVLINTNYPWASGAFKPGDPYEDGFPNSPYKNGVSWGAGDGTVPLASAIYPVTQGWAEEVGADDPTAEHSGLVKENIPAIFSFLTGQANSAQSSTVMSAMGEIDATSSAFSVDANGPLRFLITDPAGRRAGIDPATDERVAEIPGADISFDSGHGLIGFENAAEGTYTLTFSGEETGRDFRLQLSWQDGAGHSGEKKLAGQASLAAQTFTVTLSSVEPYLVVTPATEPPTTLHAEPYLVGGNELTRLTWTTAGAAQYRLYAIGAAEPFFGKKATVEGTVATFDSAIPWCGTVCTEPSSFVATSVTAGGVESFYSQAAQNDDRDGDGLSDREETILQSDISKPDTDGDGLDDLSESNMGTDLLAADTDDDGYSDRVEMDMGSDPKEATDIPACPGDFNKDGDIDGLDLASFAAGGKSLTAADFAGNFGREGCRL